MADCLNDLRARINTFVAERDWAQFHTPKNLAMAMIVEAAELVEQFQWDTPLESQQLSPEKREAAAHELADTFVYILRIAEVLEIDLIDTSPRARRRRVLGPFMWETPRLRPPG